MPIEDRPIINRWYKHLDKGYQFQVVMVDEDTVEIQHFDGDLEELDLDTWNELEIEMIEPPEDWTGSVDDIEVDDLGYTETGMSKADWSEPLQEKAETEQRDEQEEEEEGPEEQGQPEEEYRE